MKKSVSRFVPLLILCSLLVSLPQINIVKASETIYIRADGTVEGTDKIKRDGNVYTLTGDISDSIVVERDNVVVDGAGYTLQGTGNQVTGNGTGIYLGYRYNGTYDSRKNVTIKNMQIKYFNHGIELGTYTSNNTVSGNKITSCIWGIYLLWSSYNTITGNTITNNKIGINLQASLNNRIIENCITKNVDGISIGAIDRKTNVYCLRSYGNKIYHNSFNNTRSQVLDRIWGLSWIPRYGEELSVNMWDNGTTGNYWSDYNGTDINRDGIGDTPYIILKYYNYTFTDRYPLMKPVVIPELPKPQLQPSEPFPTWIVFAIAIITIIGVALLKLSIWSISQKIRKTTEKAEKQFMSE